MDGLFDGGFFATTDGGDPEKPGVKRFVPPAIHPRVLNLTNRLSQRQVPVAVEMGDAAIAFTPIGLGSIDMIAPADERVIFHLLIDDRPAALQMGKSLYERVLGRIDPELLAADIDRDVLPLLLESCLEHGMARAETLMQSRIELVAVETGGSFDLEGMDIALDISIDGEKAGRAALSTGIEDIKRIADLLADRPRPPRSYGDLDVEIRIRAAALWLDLGALQKLNTGDVLVVEEDASRWQQMAATIGECWLSPIDLSGGKPTLKGPFRKADLNDREEWMMVDPSQAQDDEEALDGLVKDRPGRRARGSSAARPPSPDTPAPDAPAQGDAGQAAPEADLDDGPAAPPADAAFDTLPVKLVFELGRLDMPLGKLQEIGPGHVLPLDRPLGEAVEIHAANRRIGVGEIVRIEDQVGVRVVRLFGQGGA